MQILNELGLDASIISALIDMGLTTDTLDLLEIPHLTALGIKPFTAGGIIRDLKEYLNNDTKSVDDMNIKELIETLIGKDIIRARAAQKRLDTKFPKFLVLNDNGEIDLELSKAHYRHLSFQNNPRPSESYKGFTVVTADQALPSPTLYRNPLNLNSVLTEDLYCDAGNYSFKGVDPHMFPLILFAVNTGKVTSDQWESVIRDFITGSNGQRWAAISRKFEDLPRTNQLRLQEAVLASTEPKFIWDDPPKTSTSRKQMLCKFLKSSFNSRELLMFLRWHVSESFSQNISQNLPFAEQAFEIVESLERSGLITMDFFVKLRTERPRRSKEINQIEHLFFPAWATTPTRKEVNNMMSSLSSSDWNYFRMVKLATAFESAYRQTEGRCSRLDTQLALLDYFSGAGRNLRQLANLLQE